MNTPGATVWDFLISLRIPIWGIIIIFIFAFCVYNAEKLLALSAAISGLFRNISTKANKNHISAGIRSSVISASKKIGNKTGDILPNDLKIKWAENDDIQSFFADNCVVIRIKQTPDPNVNYVNVIYQFVSSGLLKNQKHYFDEQIMDASTLLITQKIVSLSKPSANAYFLDSIYKPTITKDPLIDEDYDMLRCIDLNGMLFNIYLNELSKAAASISGQLPDPCLMAESGELLRFLYRIAERQPDEMIDLTYQGTYFKLGVLLAANTDTLNNTGWSSHFHYAKKLLDSGINTIYVFGIGRKEKIATKIAYAVKDSDERIVKSVTHQYRHVNTKSGNRLTATCIELDTY